MIYSLLFAGLLYWITTQTSKLDERLQNAMSEIQQAKQDHEASIRSLEERHREIDKNLARARVLLLARLSDYAKELEFWRDTVRKILYSVSKDDKASEKIISAVTDTLKTYSTRSDSLREFDSVKLLAEMFANSNNSTPDSRK
jgi:uncharacterized protein YeeX (DUF496 family)